MISVTGAFDIMADWIVLLGRESFCAAVVFAVVVTVAQLARRRGPALQVALWSLVFSRLVLPPGLTHPLSAGAIMGRLTEGPLSVAEADWDAGGVSLALVDEQLRSSGSPSTTTSFPWQSWLAAAWLIGAAATYGTYRRRRGKFTRIAGAAKSLDDPKTLALAEAWRHRLRIRRKVRLLSSAESVAPFTFGVIRPVIFIPRAVVEDPRSLEPVQKDGATADPANFVAEWR
jgi:beta-lactamase regulating signal transducer with metallopeptidase domain